MALAIIALLIVAEWLGVFSHVNDARFKEVQRLYKTIPLYPGSVEVDRSSASKDRVVRVGKSYKSDANYDALKRHYAEKLKQLGWQFVEEKPVDDWGKDLGGREINFRSGEYYMVMQYAGAKANYGWNYTLSVGWRAQ